MTRDDRGSRPGVRSAVLLVLVGLLALALTLWKIVDTNEAQAASAGQPEPMERVTGAVAVERDYTSTTTAIGTVLATRSITLRNEVPGTVRRVALEPGRVVERGDVLIALDVSVEAAELAALEARADLARATLARYERLAERQAISAIERDNSLAERDIAQAETARLRAIIERKTIRAPFRARVGIADVHPGQFLDVGTLLTTLQGVDEAVDVDFAVAQAVAAQLSVGDRLEVTPGEDDGSVLPARVTTVDARVDPITRNAAVRVRIDPAPPALAPGASVRVRVPVGAATRAVMVPVSALRKGPAGDHVYVVAEAEDERTRAHVRPVRTGPVVGDEVVILTGLAAGERVAATGSFKLFDGVLVDVASGGGSSGPGADDGESGPGAVAAAGGEG